jgi:flagellar protein FliS
MTPQTNPQAAQQYLRTRVLTATPEQLQLMLYDGAVRFCEQARAGLEKKNFEQLSTGVTKAQLIISELLCSMKRDIDPELCGKLAAIYHYVYKLLIEAGIHHSIDSLNESIELLKFQRETWALVLGQVSKDKAGAAARQMSIPAPDERMEASISMSA